MKTETKNREKELNQNIPGSYFIFILTGMKKEDTTLFGVIHIRTQEKTTSLTGIRLPMKNRKQLHLLYPSGTQMEVPNGKTFSCVFCLCDLKSKNFYLHIISWVEENYYFICNWHG